MARFVSFWGLKPGVDPDEAYKYWREKHTLWAKESKLLTEAKRYTINRVIHTFGGSDIYGFSDVWFDDMESALRTVRRLVSTPPDEFLAKWITTPNRIVVQEEDIEL